MMRRVLQGALAAASTRGYDPVRVDLIRRVVLGDMDPQSHEAENVLHPAAVGVGDPSLRSARQLRQPFVTPLVGYTRELAVCSLSLCRKKTSTLFMLVASVG